MKRKITLGIITTLICIFGSLFIQHYSGNWYQQPLAKIQRIEIKDNQQLIQAIGVNGASKGKEIALVSPYQENEIESVHFKKGNQVFYQGNKVMEKKA
ncbi:MAG TPA: hypothetical protein PLN65_02855 [Enterococcus sp.]|nr:hypothetical protein [Enterococcus sp.]